LQETDVKIATVAGILVVLIALSGYQSVSAQVANRCIFGSSPRLACNGDGPRFQALSLAGPSSFSWRYDNCPGGLGFFRMKVYSGDGVTPVMLVDSGGDKGQGTTNVGSGGRFAFDIASDCGWSLVVSDG
jgi:hypothetical protein